MKKRITLLVSLSFLALFIASEALSYSVTVGWNSNPQETVTIAGLHNGPVLAGEFTVVAIPELGDPLLDPDEFTAAGGYVGYCIDLEGGVYPGSTYPGSDLNPISAYSNPYINRFAWLMDNFATGLGFDYTNVTVSNTVTITGASKSQADAALQLAIWDALYDNFSYVQGVDTTVDALYNHYMAQLALQGAIDLNSLRYDYGFVALSARLDPTDNLQEIGYARVKPVPEPATMMLFGIGLLGLGALGRKRLFKA